MPFPVAGVILVGLTALKAKVFGGSVISEQGCAKQGQQGNTDPWSLKVDMTSEEEKRKAAQGKMESSDVLVQHERRQMHEQAEILSRLQFERATRRASEEDGEDHGVARFRFKGGKRQETVGVRPLVSSPGKGHLGLHSTGSVFVTSLDSSNAEEWLSGGSPFRAVLVTEEESTPAWFLKLAKENHSLCSFAEARCTDSKLMQKLGVTRSEALPVVALFTTYAAAILAWQENQQPGTCFIQTGMGRGDSVALRSHSASRESPEALTAKILKAIKVGDLEKEYHVRLLSRNSNPDGKWF
ncbi:hypothetical protein T484DRAFT_1963939 [Baffinella frigidus]|nr:hypothetical protein T484DRAFT_1963939 [Cryptophyta sp. CCMP2293]